jgi:hypothetical protein
LRNSVRIDGKPAKDSRLRGGLLRDNTHALGPVSESSSSFTRLGRGYELAITALAVSKEHERTDQMLTLKSKLLLFFIAVFGVGIGVLSGLADGAYSAVCLFVLPLLVAVAGMSIISDLSKPVVTVMREVKPVTVRARRDGLPPALGLVRRSVH